VEILAIDVTSGDCAQDAGGGGAFTSGDCTQGAGGCGGGGGACVKGRRFAKTGVTPGASGGAAGGGFCTQGRLFAKTGVTPGACGGVGIPDIAIRAMFESGGGVGVPDIAIRAMLESGGGGGGSRRRVGGKASQEMAQVQQEPMLKIPAYLTRQLCTVQSLPGESPLHVEKPTSSSASEALQHAA